MKRPVTALFACWLGAAALSSCAPVRRPPPEKPLPPEAPAAPPAKAKPPPPPPALRLRERERRARDLLRRDELAQALTAWKILQALDPQNREYPRQIRATRALIRHGVEEHLRAGDAAFSAGEQERAEVEYLKALALDPWVTEPLGRLREMDRERALAEESERLAKLRARTRGKEKKKSGREAVSAPMRQERDYLETGIALFKQGEYEESILEIQKYLRSFPDDAEARRYLTEARHRLAPTPPPPAAGPGPAPKAATAPPANPAPPSAEEHKAPAEEGQATAADRATAQELYDKGLRAFQTDIAQAIRYWKQALRYDPDHVQARLQMERALRMQENLEQIPAK